MLKMKWNLQPSQINIFLIIIFYILPCLLAQLWANLLYFFWPAWVWWLDFINSCKFSAEICVVGVQTTNPCPKGGGGRKTARSRDLSSEISRKDVTLGAQKCTYTLAWNSPSCCDKAYGIVFCTPMRTWLVLLERERFRQSKPHPCTCREQQRGPKNHKELANTCSGSQGSSGSSESGFRL